MKPPINTIYIADGFADDCDDLIHKCLQTETLNYQIFCNIWKDSQFALTFQGRASGAEIAEVSEEFIYIAKRYMVRNLSNFEETVAGLFLVYALVHTQPFPSFGKLRITPEDLNAINLIKEVAQTQKRYDVLYILGSLLIEGPVEYHLCEREHGLEHAVKKGFTLSSSIDRLGVRPKGVFYRQNEEVDLVRELASLERRYFRAKGLIHGTYRPDKTLDYVNETMASDMLKSLKVLINGHEYEDSAAESRNCGEDVQSIKHRAMRSNVNELRHLKSTGNSSQIGEYAPQTLNDVEVSLPSTQPPKPKRTYTKKHPCWNKKKNDKSDSDSDSDTNDHMNMPALTNDTDSDISETSSEEAGTISKNYKNVDETQNDIMIDIDLSEVPLETNSEYLGNSLIEIEIIDKYKNGEGNTIKCEKNTRNDYDGDALPDKNCKTTKKGKGRGKKSKPVDTNLGYTRKGSQINENVTVSTQRETAGEKCGNIDTCKQNNEDTKPSHMDLINGKCKVDDGKSRSSKQKTIQLQKRKNLKKTILKSKLKRLGILPVADLNDAVTDNVTKKKRKPA